MARPKGSVNKNKKSIKNKKERFNPKSTPLVLTKDNTNLNEDVDTKKIMCRRCTKKKSSDKFYETTSPILDTNGLMSICKDCCCDIYDMYFSLHNNLEIALDLTCELLDIKFSSEALKQTQSHMESLLNKGKSADRVFGYYKSKLSSTGRVNSGSNECRYKDSDIGGSSLESKVLEGNEFEEVGEELILFWGKGFDYEDYIFLESELTNWKKTHKCDNQAEITLLREICIKILNIRNRRANNESVTGDLKELQDLMKTASVDPAKANMASAGKSLDSFGIWIKEIEQFKPAEWHDKQEKYKDMDGFIPYIQNYIVRPIKNFITGNRDFHINDSIDLDANENEGDDNG